jgi:hypothetical protein
MLDETKNSTVNGGPTTSPGEDGKMVQQTGIDVTAREAAAKVASDIPDGGLVAWLQVLGCFFLWWNAWYSG